MRFSGQNELYGGPTRWVTNKIGSFRGGCHSGLYPSEYRAQAAGERVGKRQLQRGGNRAGRVVPLAQFTAVRRAEWHRQQVGQSAVAVFGAASDRAASISQRGKNEYH